MAVSMPRRPAFLKAASHTIELYKEELVGTVIDVTYQDRNRTTYRAKVTKWNPSTGFHHINSKGFSTWRNDAFTDQIDVNVMNVKGLIHIPDPQPGRSTSPAATARAPPAGKGKGKGKSKGKGKGKAAKRRYGEELVGELLEVTYPEGTFRVRVVDYIRQRQWHIVDSAGLSTWEGESFTDELIISEMEDEGALVFLGGGGGGG